MTSFATSRKGKVKDYMIPAMATPEPSNKCSNCNQPMTAWVNIVVDSKWKSPEKIGTMQQSLGHNNEHWCFACIRGKNDPKWLKPT